MPGRNGLIEVMGRIGLLVEATVGKIATPENRRPNVSIKSVKRDPDRAVTFFVVGFVIFTLTLSMEKSLKMVSVRHKNLDL